MFRMCKMFDFTYHREICQGERQQVKELKAYRGWAKTTF